MNRFDKLLSYIYPFLIESTSSEHNPLLEVIYSSGRHRLNSKNANYSYGGLYDLFNLVFKQIEIDWKCVSDILILGFGAGCTVPLIRRYNADCKIIGVEVDSKVIEFGEKYFDIKHFNDLTIICDSASNFVQSTNQNYDLIIVDVFIDLDVPKEVETVFFIQNLRRILNNNGTVIFNKLTPTKALKKQIPELKKLYQEVFRDVNIHSFMETSRVFIAKK
jgi:spermidine synthase